MWIYLGILCSLLLGCYDILKKRGVQQNAVLPTLFVSTCFACATAMPLLIGSLLFPNLFAQLNLYVRPIQGDLHIKIAIKSGIVATSWVLSFFALKHLPISIVAPIRAAGPFFTLFGAVFLYGEAPSALQWLGVGLIMISFVFFSKIGKSEGIRFEKNRWVLFAFLATLAGSISSLYDKYLIQGLNLEPQLLQVWFSVYLVAILGAVLLVVRGFPNTTRTRFQWRWSIPLIGVFLILADFVYFTALSSDEAMIIVLSSLKRFRVFIALFLGGMIFKELNKRKKALALVVILAGVGFIVYSAD